MIKCNVKWFMWVALAVPAVVLAMATVASAAEKEHHLTGEFARFDQCPIDNPQVEGGCIFADAHGGEFQIGNMNTPITKPLALQFGFYEREDGELVLVPATNGESLVKVAQVVTGGIFALVKEGRYPWYLRNFCKNFPSNSDCKVTATPELIGQPFLNESHLLIEEGTALELPLRLHLKNPFLGGKCYIGSASSPIVLALTTGSMPPLGIEPGLKGQLGKIEVAGEGTILVVPGDETVTNAYSAAGAEGCGGPQSLIVDKEIDEKQALPSPAGHNRARLISTLYQAGVNRVREFEE